MIMKKKAHNSRMDFGRCAALMGALLLILQFVMSNCLTVVLGVSFVAGVVVLALVLGQS